MILIMLSLVSIYILWIFYLSVMSLKRAKDAGTISKVALYLGYPVLLVGLILDAMVNVWILTLILIELPREATVSERLSRHGQQGGWRGDFSRWFCEMLLDTFDPSGDHC